MNEWKQVFEKLKFRAEDFANLFQPIYELNGWALYNNKSKSMEVPNDEQLLSLIYELLDSLEKNVFSNNFDGFSEVSSGRILFRATNYPQVGPNLSMELVAEEVWYTPEDSEESILN